MTETELPPVNLRQQRENLSILAWTAFLRGAHTTVYNVIWQPFVLSLGASMPALGLLNSLGGMNGIVTTLVQPLGGWLADRFGRLPFLAAASIAYIVGYGLFALAGWLNVWILLGVGAVFLGIAALSFPARNSMTAESVHADKRGTAFSLILLAATLPGIIAPTLGGWIADRAGFVAVFPIAMALEAAALYLVWRWMHETRPANREGVSWREAAQVLARSIVPPKGMTGFFMACAGDSFAWGVGWGLVYGMLTETLHFTAEQLGIMASVTSIAWAISQMPIGRYIDKQRAVPVLVFSESLGIPLMLILITQTRFEIIALSMILFALTAATWVPVVNTYLTRRVPDSERAEAFGRLNMFRGLVAFPAPTLGGLLYAWGGMRLPLLANMIGSIVVVCILLFFVREPPIENPKESMESI